MFVAAYHNRAARSAGVQNRERFLPRGLPGEHLLEEVVLALPLSTKERID